MPDNRISTAVDSLTSLPPCAPSLLTSEGREDATGRDWCNLQHSCLVNGKQGKHAVMKLANWWMLKCIPFTYAYNDHCKSTAKWIVKNELWPLFGCVWQISRRKKPLILVSSPRRLLRFVVLAEVAQTKAKVRLFNDHKTAQFSLFCTQAKIETTLLLFRSISN